METSAIEKKIIPALQRGESMPAMSKDPLTQTGRKLSFALEGREAGNKLWFFFSTANVSSDNYSPVDLHKFQCS